VANGGRGEICVVAPEDGRQCHGLPHAMSQKAISASMTLGK
jgi:hypothetical protein